MANATTWVHVFEEDTPDGAVYRPVDDNIPLSRRPRERLAMGDDGQASVFLPGPDDRFIEQPATWHEDGDHVVVRTTARGAAPSRELVIVERTPKRLVVRRR